MYRLFTIISLLIFVPVAGWAQKNRQVKAVVAGKTDRQPIADATVTLFRVPDSIPYDHILTTKKGQFQFRKLDTGRYILTVSATSHIPLRVDFDNRTESAAIPDTLLLDIAYKQEDEVVVRGLINPVTVKKDTLEFNPAAFRTPQDEAIEELIKKIPGFSLDKDGALVYNGEKVKEILVDGKPFTLDPNLPITKILPVHIIEKIQLIDQRPKDQRFNKNDDGERNKVLNLTIKKNKKRGWFGKAVAATGSNELVEANANINRFNNNRKMLTNIRGGNTGQSGFSGVQLLPGKNRSLGLGAGYQDAWKEKMNFSANGGFNENATENRFSSVRTTFLPGDSALVAENQSVVNNKNSSKNFSVSLNNEPDETQNYTIEAGYNASNGSSERMAASGTQNQVKKPVNRFTNSNRSNNNNEQYNISFTYNKQLDTFGRSFSIRTSVQAMNNNNNQYMFSENTFFDAGGGVLRTDSIDQKREIRARSTNRQVSLNYSMPLFSKFNLTVNYALQWNNSRSGVEVFDFEKNNAGYTRYNDSLSNGFSLLAVGHQGVVSVGRMFKGLSYTLRLGFRQQNNRNKNYDSLNVVTQRFLNFTPGLSLYYYKKDRPNIRFNYNGITNQPSIQQRQPVIDNSHPLYLRLGNPDLRPEYTNQLSLNVNRSYSKSMLSYSVGLNFSNTFNKITESVAFNSEGRQVSKPVNLSGVYNAFISNSLGIPLSKRKRHNIGLTVSLRKSRTVSLLNEQLNRGNDFSANTTFSLNTG
ncbi:MAG: TonB-dependent receptor, partial [Dinghuibacter sp.]|nr:TonB-dependent receptor [Dinghuibacter sp.]